MKKLLPALLLLAPLSSYAAETVEADARITINGQSGEIIINKNTNAKIELHLAGNDDIGKSADYYVTAFLPANKTCVASEVGLENEVCGFTYKAGTQGWSNLPFGSSLTGQVVSFDNFTLLDSKLPVGTYQVTFFVVNNLELSLIAGDEISLTITE